MTASPAALDLARQRAAQELRAERRLALWLCAPAALVMVLVVGYPLLELLRLSFGGYAEVLGDGRWWRAVAVTLGLVVAGTSLSMMLGLLIAYVVHHLTVGRGVVRAAVLVPYAVVSVVAAIGTAGLFEDLLPVDRPASALAVVVLADAWRTVPFVALVLMAALALVPDDLMTAADLDGASRWQRFTMVVAPMLRPALLSALVFRVLDNARTFDTVHVLTGGADGTATVAVLTHRWFIVEGELARGAASGVLLLVLAVLLAVGAALAVDRLLPGDRR